MTTTMSVLSKFFFVMCLLVTSQATNAQVRISKNIPKSGKGGVFIKNHDGPNSIFFSPPYGENMHQSYFNVCLENIRPGKLKIMLEYETTYKVPAYAVYKLDEGEWNYTPVLDTARYEIQIPEGTKRCYFASGIPFTYGDMLTYMDKLPEDYTEIIDLDRYSNDGRVVKVVKITDKTEKDDSKQLVWILSGQHPFELPGIHTAKEMIDYLISDAPEAVALRKNTLFYICPIVDVDASDRGLTGKRKVGRGTYAYPLQDFNWDWNVELNSTKPIKNTQGGPNAYNNISHPQVKSLQEMIYQTSLKNPLRFFFDSHSPWPDKIINDTSAFHIIDKYLPKSKRSYVNSQSHSRKFWNEYEQYMGFRPVVLTDEAPGSLSSSSGKLRHAFSYGPDQQYDYERSADYWVDSENSLFYRNTLAQPNILFSVTLETGWHQTPKYEDGSRGFWDIPTLQKHASSLCLAMYQMMASFNIEQPGDIIVDINKENKSIEFNGEWSELNGMLPNTPMHYHEKAAMTTTEAGSSVRIPVQIPYSGIFDIYNWHNPIVYSAFEPTPNHLLNDEKVQITIFNGEEYYQLSFDQTQIGGAWQKLTTLYFYKDKKAPFIEIRKVIDDHKVVQADAIRLSPSLGLAAPDFTLK